MKKDYWQKRAVKAEMLLSTVSAIAHRNGEERIEQEIDAYFESVAAGEVNDVKLPPPGDSRRE